MDYADLYHPPLLISRTFYDFNKLRPHNFSKQVYSITHINILSDEAIEHYDSFNDSTQNTTVRRCPRHFGGGYGLFVETIIPQDAYIVEYFGERIVSGEDELRNQLYRDQGIIGDYFASLNDEIVIDATLIGNNSRCINDSCNPNAGQDPITLKVSSYNILWMYALEDI